MDVAEPRRGRKLSPHKPASYDSETGTSGLSCLNGGPSRGITGDSKAPGVTELGVELASGEGPERDSD